MFVVTIEHIWHFSVSDDLLSSYGHCVNVHEYENLNTADKEPCVPLSKLLTV
jgi:hypothetical protein